MLWILLYAGLTFNTYSVTEGTTASASDVSRDGEDGAMSPRNSATQENATSKVSGKAVKNVLRHFSHFFQQNLIIKFPTMVISTSSSFIQIKYTIKIYKSWKVATTAVERLKAHYADFFSS
jgi:hypothetical protein